MSIEALVIPAAKPKVGVSVRSALAAIGKPRVLVPTSAITIDIGETLTVDGSLVLNGSVSGPTSFIDSIIDGGNASSTYTTAFDIDGGGA
jgi:hypothetical protein